MGVEERAAESDEGDHQKVEDRPPDLALFFEILGCEVDKDWGDDGELVGQEIEDGSDDIIP